MRLPRNTVVFFASAFLGLSILGVWAYSHLSVIGVIHYEPHGDVEIHANRGHLAVRSTTVNSDWRGDLHDESGLGWTAGASWAYDDSPPPPRNAAVRSDRRGFGFLLRAYDVPTVLNAAGGKDVGFACREVQVPLLAIALPPTVLAGWAGLKWRAARQSGRPAFAVIRACPGGTEPMPERSDASPAATAAYTAARADPFPRPADGPVPTHDGLRPLEAGPPRPPQCVPPVRA